MNSGTGSVIFGIAMVLALGWIAAIRTYTRSGRGVTVGHVNTAVLFVISLLLIAFFPISPFHLLWMYPISFVLGIVSLTFPFSFLSAPGKILTFIACIGLNKAEIQKNRERVRRGVELVDREGLTVEEAKKRLEEEGY